jgi:hypothetical protein
VTETTSSPLTPSLGHGIVDGVEADVPLLAGVYSSILHYLEAVAALKSATDGKAVVEKMKSMPTDDPLFGKGEVRVDGTVTHPAYLFEVKKPEESKYPGDFFKLRDHSGGRGVPAVER